MQPKSLALVAPQDAAEEICRELEERVGKRHYDHWFRNKTTLRAVDDELIVGLSSPYVLKWVQSHFGPALLAAAQAALGPAARIRFEVDRNACSATLRKEPDAPAPLSRAVATASPESEHAAITDGVGRRGETPPPSPPRQGRRFLSLSDFVPGACNEMALMAARQTCDAPGARYNPLYLHGGVGTGKTHLLEGIYGQLRRQFPSLQVMFLSAEAFTNYFTQALREKTLPSFRQRFRGVDVLLIDDVDFLNNKRAIQEEFLHTFQQLESQGRQIALTADRHPRLLSGFSDELMTRCLSGLVCRLEAPDLATREQIVASRAARMGLDAAPEALSFVAQRFKSNVRELEGALNCLATYRSMLGKRVTLSAARRVLADLERDCVRIVRLGDVEQAVCGFFGVEPKELRSAKRTRSVAQPRMLAIYLMRKHTQAAYTEIGQYFGGRNHSTIISAERQVNKWLQSDESIRIAAQSLTVGEVVDALEQQLRAS